MGMNTFSISDVINILKKRYKIIILITLITTMYGTYVGLFKMKPSYQASARIMIGKTGQIQDLYSVEDTATYKSFLETYTQVVRTDEVLNAALSKAGINKYAGEVKGGLGFSVSETFPEMTIFYSGGSPDGMIEIINAVISNFEEQAKQIVGDSKIKVLQEPFIFTSMPNKKKMIIVGFMAGLLFSIGLVFALDFLDNTIRRRDQLEKVLPVPVLGEIPDYKEKLYRRS